ncbi:MAG: flippase-like domain-containing protein [Oscillospiraceae bacterium]|nr:flippase-like domain-containing protein [Oscillospiraceae bacterium]
MRKSTKISLAFCAFAFLFMVFYLVFFDGKQVYNALRSVKVSYIFIAVLFIAAYLFLESLAVHAVTKTVHPPHKLRRTVVITLIGHYFNCITPFATGGQPMQIYYMTRYGVSLGGSVVALLSRFIVYQFVLTVYTAAVLFANFSYYTKELGGLMFLTIIGFSVNFCVLFALITLAFFKKTAEKISHGAIKIAAKLRLIKEVKKKIAYIDGELEQYHKNFELIRKNPLLVLKLMILSAFQLTVFFSVSFVIYRGLGLSGVSPFIIISNQAFVLMISSFVPLPGAIGAAEGSYGLFFAPIFGESITFSVFLWRVLTFYLPIVAGLITTVLVSARRR